MAPKMIFNNIPRNIDSDLSLGSNSKMVDELAKHVSMSARLQTALLAVDRIHFVDTKSDAYQPYLSSHIFKSKCLIGKDEHIVSVTSRPLVIAHSLSLLGDIEGKKVLEVGTGLGYQTAVLSLLAGPKGEVFTSEIIPDLLKRTMENIEELKKSLFTGSDLKTNLSMDDMWNSIAGKVNYFPSLKTLITQNAPFDAIILGCALTIEQAANFLNFLKPTGSLVAPVEANNKKHYISAFKPEGHGEVLSAMPREFVKFQDNVWENKD